jgi:tetratricopeptide (TPR) repeat protein
MEEASKIAERVLSTNREDRRGNEFTAELALWTWDYEKALRHYRQVQWSPLFSFIWRAPAAYHRTRLGFVLMKLGERSEAENLFTQNEKLCKEKIAAGDRRYGLFEVIAMINAVRGNREEALKWLEEAIEAGWGWHDVALKDPIWESLHDEPRFQQMMAEVKAKVDQMRRRAAEMEEEWD